MSLNDENDTNHLSDLDTVDLLFGDLIRVSKDDECFVAIDHLTHIAEVGSTEAEAVNNLRQAIREHINVVKNTLEQMRDFDRAFREDAGDN